ncbi:hypothetical protein ACFU6S_31955 [Streptomyces sp. NPDC057456]|uniref:hypothetical protein n=1 Tax=Streptomyces sp. NPDC057456 TaxID=3346139 RepID=UPI0036AE2C09
MPLLDPFPDPAPDPLPKSAPDPVPEESPPARSSPTRSTWSMLSRLSRSSPAAEAAMINSPHSSISARASWS